MAGEDELARLGQALAAWSQGAGGLVAGHRAYMWRGRQGGLVRGVVRGVGVSLLCGVEVHARVLQENTARFAKGLEGHHALLWGARGMGKSSLVRAVCAEEGEEALALVAVDGEHQDSLPWLWDVLAAHAERRCVVLCDDMSFAPEDSGAKALKVALDGGLGGAPENVMVYATSNRRHMVRDTHEEEPGDETHERISLSDRFGLWLGFHPCNQELYLAMVARYITAFDLEPHTSWEKEALAWAVGRGGRSGRVAWQYVVERAGVLGRPLRGLLSRE